MATIITNQATLNYRYGNITARTVSNVTSALLNGPLSITKSSLSDSYRLGQDITYLITVTNNGNAQVNGVVVTDDLGSYELNGNTITPLTYIGPAQLFINGVFNSILQPVVGEDNITFNISSIPANGNAQIMYLTRINSSACGAAEAYITNTATAYLNCDCPCEGPATASHTITAEEFADVRMVKNVCPNPATCGEVLNYTITVYNYGNMEATEIVLTDSFEPALTDITVTVDGDIIPSENYSYVNGVLTLPSAGSDYSISIPPAVFTQDPVTGVCTVTPSSVVITISGTI